MQMACTRIELDSIPTDSAEAKKYIYDLFKEKVCEKIRKVTKKIKKNNN